MPAWVIGSCWQSVWTGTHRMQMSHSTPWCGSSVLTDQGSGNCLCSSHLSVEWWVIIVPSHQQQDWHTNHKSVLSMPAAADVYRLKKARYKLSPQKCILFKQKVEYLGLLLVRKALLQILKGLQQEANWWIWQWHRSVQTNAIWGAPKQLFHQHESAANSSQGKWTIQWTWFQIWNCYKVIVSTSIGL